MISFKAGSTNDVSLLSFSPDACVLAVGLEWQRTELRVPTTGELLFASASGAGRHALFWGGPHRRTLVVNRHGSGLVWVDADEARVLPPLPGWAGHGSACFTSDGRYGINTRELYRNGDLSCWKQTPDGFQSVWKRKMSTNSVASFRTLHCFLPDDDRFVYSEQRGKWGDGLTLVVASRTDANDVAEGHFPNHGVSYHGASPDGKWLALGASYGPSITIYRADDLTETPIRLTNKNRRHYTDLAFHPSGEFLAATSNDATVTFFDTKTFAEQRAYTWKIGRLRSVAFSPDGALAAVGSDKGQVVVWDVDV